MSMPPSMPLLGVDFTSAPGRRKPITVARGRLEGGVLRLDGLDALPSFAGFEALLAKPGPWLGAFDFPFGLPREFVDSLHLGADIDTVTARLHRHCADRMAFRALVDTWGNARPAGRRLIHRRTDTAAPGVSSTSPLQTRYVPVGFMFYEGLSRLVGAGVSIPAMRRGDEARIALEGYPGLLARQLVGRRSYKNAGGDDRLQARLQMLGALREGCPRLGLRLQLSPEQHERLVEDRSGDRLDALLCLAQAAWATGRPRFGLPEYVDPVEGWIVGA